MLDYRPDLDPATPDLVTGIVDMVPSAKGYRTFPTPQLHTAQTLTLNASETNGITSLFATQWLSFPNGIIFAGTNKRILLYHFTGGYLDVSKAAGYTLSGQSMISQDSTTAFDFCAFGDVIIAAHKNDLPQFRSGVDYGATTKFADITTPVPKASVCETASNFVFMGDCTSWSTVTGSQDIVAWSAIGNYQDWTVNPTVTQSSYAQFSDTPGPITALKRLRDGIVVFKSNSMYYGRYVGVGTNSPIWDFVKISDKIGCVGHRSVVNIDNELIFVGPNDVYRFDGTRPVSITDGVWETHIRNKTFDATTARVMLMGHDKPNSSVLMTAITATGSYTLVWSYKYNRWGYLYDPNETGANVFCKTNCDTFTSITTSGTGAITISAGHANLYSLFAVKTAPTAAACYNRVATYGAYQSLTTEAYGSDAAVTRFSRLTPRWITAPANCGLRVDTKATLGEAWTTGAIPLNATAMDSHKRFDMSASGGSAANWAQFYIAPAAGAAEVAGFVVDPKPAGRK